MESGGKFTLLKQPKSKPGLPVIPDWDTKFTQDQPNPDDLCVCGSCGNLAKEWQAQTKCTNCGKQE